MLAALDRACRIEEALERRARAGSRREYVAASAEVATALEEMRRAGGADGSSRPLRVGGGD